MHQKCVSAYLEKETETKNEQLQKNGGIIPMFCAIGRKRFVFS